MNLLLIDELIITSLTDNYYDALRKDEKVAYINVSESIKG